MSFSYATGLIFKESHGIPAGLVFLAAVFIIFIGTSLHIGWSIKSDKRQRKKSHFELEVLKVIRWVLFPAALDTSFRIISYSRASKLPFLASAGGFFLL